MHTMMKYIILMLLSSSIRGFAPPTQLSFTLPARTMTRTRTQTQTQPITQTSSLFLTRSTQPHPPSQSLNPLVFTASQKIKRYSYISWWSQLILSTISSTTIIFANSVTKASSSFSNPLTSPVTNGIFLASTGITIGFLSLIWTWGLTRLGRRLSRKVSERASEPCDKKEESEATSERASQQHHALVVTSSLLTSLAAHFARCSLARAKLLNMATSTTEITHSNCFCSFAVRCLLLHLIKNAPAQLTTPSTASSMLRRSLKINIYLNCLGMLVTVLGAEQIVGVLVAKILSTQGLSPFAVQGAAAGSFGATQTVQALDIFVVQANTNTLLSHLLSLCSCLWLWRWVGKLKDESNNFV